MSKLKPCPFCDGPATFCTTLEITGGYGAIVLCMRCNAKTDSLYAHDEEDAKIMAAACWNTRAERTCHPVEQLPPNESLSTPVRLSCGHVVEGIVDGEARMLPNFCEVCGAKVVVVL